MLTMIKILTGICVVYLLHEVGNYVDDINGVWRAEE